MARRVSGIIRRVVLMHLSAAAPLLIGCGDGGRTVPSADSGAPHDSGICNEAVDAGAPCTIISCLPPTTSGVIRDSCATAQYAIYGTAEQCDGDGGAVPASTCRAICPTLTDDAGVTLPFYSCFFSGRNVDCEYGDNFCYVTGRRPRGLRRCAPDRAAGRVARYLARMAHLEAASVPAFSRLARELAEHGAPRRLLRAAVRAGEDEKRHARVVTDLAERAGATVRRPQVRRGRARSLEAMAIENAVEGCVRETFGAAVAVAQSLTASDPRVRAALRRIAIDETRHAELSWRVARWVDGRLDPAARRRVASARLRAASALLASAGAPVHPELVQQLGIPPAPVAVAMAQQLARALWAPPSFSVE
ncbi:MAG TPA: ferritin-like domain-containing protein [Polyangiaceae bacterium]